MFFKDWASNRDTEIWPSKTGTVGHRVPEADPKHRSLPLWDDEGGRDGDSG